MNAWMKAPPLQSRVPRCKLLRFVTRTVLSVAACALAAVACGASAQTATNPVLYSLNKDSTFAEGCIPPCLCPDIVPVPVGGAFWLAATGYDGLYDNYTVTYVNWSVPINGSNVIVSGSGTYKWGGEFALLQQLVLDLQLGSAPAARFDSGLVPVAAPFPEIKVNISTTNQICFSKGFSLHASPAPVLRPQFVLADTNKFVLAWPVTAASVVLEESTDLTATNWNPVTNHPTTIGQENQVQLARPPGNRFYRLVAH
jgi:hypothetical protein